MLVQHSGVSASQTFCVICFMDVVMIIGNSENLMIFEC